MRVLIITNLFPNAAHPRAASFNRQQFAALGKTCDVEVLATQAWYPAQRLLGKFATHQVAGELPKEEVIDGLRVHHPRTLHIPKFGRSIAAPLFAASLLPTVRRYRSKVDVVLGSWAHPDGCAAVALAKLLGVPSVVKLHGTDINTGMHLAGPRRAMKAMLPKADAIVSVSSELSRRVMTLGVSPERIHLVMNGVNASMFRPQSRSEARRALGLPESGKLALCVGNLIDAKGVLDLRDAFARIADSNPDLQLVFVGDGKARASLETNMPPRMTVAGSQPFEKIPLWMAASDLLVLPSWNEGTPNVVLEALACGRRVLASNVGGVPDLITSDALGALVPAKDPEALALALAREYSVPYSPEAVAEAGARGDWQKSAADLEAVLASVLHS